VRVPDRSLPNSLPSRPGPGFWDSAKSGIITVSGAGVGSPMWAKTPAPRFYPDTPNMTKPASLQPLEELFDLDFVLDETNDPAIFGRYGRRDVDACRYWMRGDVVAGLCARASGITSTNWLNKPEWADLEVLLLGENNFTDLVIPAGMTKLQHLDLNASPELTSVRFAGSQPHLRRLEATDCPELSTFVVPTDCPDLHYFDLNGCALTSFALDGDFSSLVYLDLTKSPKLQAFSLAGNFAALLSLHLRAAAQLETLEIDTPLPALDTLDLAHCPMLKAIPQDTIMTSPLERFYGKGTTPKNCPGAFLERNDNALEAVRGWITELRRNPDSNQENKTIKIQVTGNGNVGKSTLLCALGEEELCCTHENHDRTHGIEIDQIEWKQKDIILNYWDFGGQEIYRGTHRLFAAERALHLLVFDPDSEAEAGGRGSNRTGGKEGKQAIQYFYDTIRHGVGNSITVLQNKRELLPNKNSKIEAWANENNLGFRQIDAKAGTGLWQLKRQLVREIQELPSYKMVFPASWLAVRDWFVENLQPETVEAGKVERVIDRDRFAAICRDKGVGEEYEDLLLVYLAAAGYCYRHERLEGEIIADQRWALTGIYQLFDPEDVSRELADSEGKVRVKRLFQYFDETEAYNYTTDEKWLLLDFLESCGLCFSVTDREDRAGEQRTLNDRYILPEYLQLEEDPREAEYWNQLGENAIVLRKPVDYINYPAFHGFLCKIGRKTTRPRLWYSGVDVATGEGERFMVRLVPGKQPYYEIRLTAGSEGWIKVLKEESSLGEDGWETISGAASDRQEMALPEKGGKKLDDLPNQLAGIQDTPAFFLFANPAGTAQISCEKELATLRRYRDEHDEQRFFDFIGKGKLSYGSLVDALCSVREPRIIHFAGHGDNTSENAVDRGLVVYEDEGAQSDILNANRLGAVFAEAKARHNPQLELVVLNACVSSEQAIAISKAGIYVVGTTIEIGDKSAIRFALAFYKECAKAEVLDTPCLRAAMNMGVIAGIGKYGNRAEGVYQLYFNGEAVSFR
jgi:GTPase SAR1 family protein